MESLIPAKPLAPTVDLATAERVDSRELAAVAAQTFPLACPPAMTAENIAVFVETNLSPARFAEYLADPDRAILVAAQCRRIVGYAMLVRGVADDADVQRAVAIRPAAELSKMYVLPEHHGAGVAPALMERALTIAQGWAARCVWLGVNQKNTRAQRFYAKSGFGVSGTRSFQVGARREADFVMVRELR